MCIRDRAKGLYGRYADSRKSMEQYAGGVITEGHSEELKLRWKEDWQKRIRQAEADAAALASETGDVRQGRRYFLEQWELMMGQLKGQLERQAAAQKEKIREKKKRKEDKEAVEGRRALGRQSLEEASERKQQAQKMLAESQAKERELESRLKEMESSLPYENRKACLLYTSRCV